MQYTAAVYAENKKKWGKLNEMREDIEKTLGSRDDAANKMTKFMTAQMRGLISRKIVLPITYKGASLVIKKEGFATKYSHSYISRPISTNVDLLDFLGKNKQAHDYIMGRIRNKQKKNLLEIFIRCVNYTPKPISVTMSAKKTIIDPDGRKIVVSGIVVSARDVGYNVTMGYNYLDGNAPRTGMVEHDDWESNIVKEQLYLPFWKALTKFKRHALKEQKRIEKVFARITKECEPIIVAHIQNSAAPEVEA